MIKISQHIDATQWKNLTHSSLYSSYFQTVECYNFYLSLNFMETFLLGVEENGLLKGVVCGYVVANGGVVQRYFSRRAVVHGGPLLANDISQEALLALLSAVKNDLRKKAIYIEFRNNHNYSVFKTSFEESGFQYCPHLNYIVDTRDGKEMFQNISESKRRQIKKGMASGLMIQKASTQVEIDGFYNILKKLYRKEVKKPLFPKEFFEKLIKQPHAFLLVAKYQNEIISGMACVTGAENTIYEWFVCGDKMDKRKLYPSVAITYSALKYANENGFNRFDFMGAGKPDEHYGVREFKEKFGGKLVEYGRFVCVNNSFLYNLGTKVIKAMLRL